MHGTYLLAFSGVAGIAIGLTIVLAASYIINKRTGGKK